MPTLFKNRWFLIGVVVILLVVSGFAVRARAASTQKTQITTTKAQTTSFTKTVQSSGKTKAKKDVLLTFQTSGQLAWVGVKEGDHVAAYQAIAGQDPRQVQNSLETSLRNYSEQRDTFDQTQQVTYNGHTPTDALNDTMKRILEKNQWDLDKAVLDVELKHLALEYATLVSPIDGIVTRVDTPVAGVNVTPTTATFEIVDPTSLVFEASVDETDVGTLVVGQKATVTLDAFPDTTFPATVSYISYAAVTSTGGATVFPVEVTLQTDKPVRFGMNGDVTITTRTRDNVLVVPLDSVREDDKGSYVYKKVGNTYKKTTIKTEDQNSDSAVIESGLSEGDAVVTKGFASVK